MATRDERRSASQQRQRSTSRPRTPRPTTPLRPSSRSSFRESARGSVHGDAAFPLNAFEPAFAELSDAMADLEANMMHFQIMHESLSRFTESFASFLYGVNMNAFCVEFPEAPVPESFTRARQMEENQPAMQVPEKSREADADATFMTTDTSFVDNPPASSKAATPKKFSSTRGTSRGRGTVNTRGASTRGRASSGIARGPTRGARPSGLPRGRGMRPV
ncbi:hypothetical protein MCOR25_004737 [Pyricularia grisea]|uniref:DASH complex subunit DAM1 n=1 Tax=Pyricularia grisea TaxID=148305 RepID=A0A6P8AVC8_PYRGI|nr:uncharacterized protein PgNI_08398 [Pyricularia grisea]KAI6368053.1 hypothetical protein MCOR25_004737 [Pyricularia grisea]TLD06119.1 hypothetical protein PgNI_08398 [Pyricularia grisea]